MEGIFVTGTNTGVGKTTVCAGLLKIAADKGPAAYWKPVQTGTVIGDDTDEVQGLTALSSAYFLDPTYRLPEPSAPSIAARHLSEPIQVEKILDAWKAQPKKFRVVEGAGGILVPLNDDVLQVSLMERLGLPVIIVGEDRLGTINQTLLTIRGCRDSKLNILGVILTKSSQGLRNAEAIERFGKVEVLGVFEHKTDKKAVVTAISNHDRLRKLFGLSPIPV